MILDFVGVRHCALTMTMTITITRHGQSPQGLRGD